MPKHYLCVLSILLHSDAVNITEAGEVCVRGNDSFPIPNLINKHDI